MSLLILTNALKILKAVLTLLSDFKLPHSSEIARNYPRTHPHHASIVSALINARRNINQAHAAISSAINCLVDVQKKIEETHE